MDLQTSLIKHLWLPLIYKRERDNFLLWHYCTYSCLLGEVQNSCTLCKGIFLYFSGRICRYSGEGTVLDFHSWPGHANSGCPKAKAVHSADITCWFGSYLSNWFGVLLPWRIWTPLLPWDPKDFLPSHSSPSQNGAPRQISDVHITMWSLCSHFLILVHQKETVPVFYRVIWAEDILSGLKGKIHGRTHG